MEKENKVPAELNRRWVIARLLEISGAYLDIPAIEEAFFSSDEIKLSIPIMKARCRQLSKNGAITKRC